LVCVSLQANIGIACHLVRGHFLRVLSNPLFIYSYHPTLQV